MDYTAPAFHLSHLTKHIMRTVLYYDIFSYPLKQDEIYTFLGSNSINKRQLQHALDELVANDILHFQNGFYFLGQNPGVTINRQKANAKARKMMPVARRMSRLISWFPFVRAVGLSGSISKNCMDRQSDIDFFVMTDPGRLWLARTLLMLFKKVFLLNSRKYFCLNYFISTDNLHIKDHNLFTATELVTMIPTYGQQHFRKFYAANKWVREYLPNSTNHNPEKVRQDSSLGVKWLLELLLKGKAGSSLDKYCMKLTTHIWRKKFTAMDKEEFDLALRSRRDVSKHHPQNFQKKVLLRLEEKKKAFEEKTGLSLTDKQPANYG